MSWQDLPKPDGVGEITEADGGFEVAIAIPTDEDGFFGRECSSCEAPFKMRSDEYEALPDEIELTCPYCGHRESKPSRCPRGAGVWFRATLSSARRRVSRVHPRPLPG
jgi:hypothetical protein